MNIKGVTFYWGTDFLPKGKEFDPVAMVLHMPTSDFKVDYLDEEVTQAYESLAEQATEMNCNVVILQDVKDTHAGDSVCVHVRVTGHAMDKDT